MTDTIALTGIVGTPPKDHHTPSGLSICSFRLASSQRRFDRARNDWVDGDTNWYTVTAFRHLADNVMACVGKGDHVVVLGRLRVRSWENAERSGTTVEVDADAIAHDLVWGRSQFTRISPSRGSQGGAGEASESGVQDPRPTSTAGLPPAGTPLTQSSPGGVPPTEGSPSERAPSDDERLAAAASPLVPDPWASAPGTGAPGDDESPF